MGQAKSRGTFEDRRAAAILLQAQREVEAAAQRAERKLIDRLRQIEADAIYIANHGRPRRKRLPALIGITATVAAMVAAQSDD